MSKTLYGSAKNDNKFIKRGDALRNRGEWCLDRRQTYRRMIMTEDMPTWLQPVEAMAAHYEPIWCPKEFNEDGSPNPNCYHYSLPNSDSPWAIRRNISVIETTRGYKKFMTNSITRRAPGIN
jgi:hypothetical protein